MAKELRLWNGRPYGVLPQSEWKHASVCVAAYSIADARRVCVEAGMNDPGANEVNEYWSECWGNDMNGIAPERGIWVSKGGQAKKLPSNALAQADAACGVSPGATGSAAHYGGRTMATRKIEEIWPGLQPMAKKAQLIAETQGRPAYVALNPTGDVSADFPGVDCHRVHANGDVDCCVCAP